MKNYSIIKKNINEITSSTNKDDSFYSFQSYPRNYKFIHRQKNGIYIGNKIFHKINKIQKNQINTNKKLDLILSIIKIKLLSEYDYNISHYGFSIYKQNKSNILNEIKTKEDNDLNIKDDFGVIASIKKEPYNPSNNLYKIKLQKIYDNKNNNTSIENNGNLSQIINDFLNENKNEKNNNGENGNNNINNGNDYANNIENNINGFNNNININNENFDIKKEIKKNIIIKNSNDKLFDDFNNNINSLLNNLNKPFKKDIDLNKYKFELNENNNINNNGDGINDILNVEKKDIVNKSDKMELRDLINIKEKNSNMIEKDNFQNININEEKMNMDNNINKILKNENEKELEKRFDNSQSDNISVKSNQSTSSAKKSNQSSSRKIRGFNFKNNIKMKKYNANKFNSISSPNNNQKK